MKSRSKAKGRSRLYDFTVIGGGIVGLATAYHLVHAYPQAAVLVLEKEQSLGLHQTGNKQRCHPLWHILQTGEFKSAVCNGRQPEDS